jgi:hypothetical protein
MKGLTVILYIALAFSAISCDDCKDCEPFTQEPFLEVRFLNKTDSSKRIIIIDSVNQVYGKDLRHFKDTTSIYNFPLDMHHDTSVFQLVYRDTSALQTPLTDSIIIIYSREIIRREDNYFIVECDLDSFKAFGEATLVCKDTTSSECLSNEAYAKIYN